MNRYTAIFILFIVALFSTEKARAQWDVHFNNYWALPGYYNPAWAGQTDKLNIVGTYSMQLSSFTHAPKTMYFGADMPFSLFNKKQGVGIGFYNDAIGLFRNERTWLQYSFKKQFGKSRLGIGVQLGIVNVSFDPTNIYLGETTSTTDPAFPTSQQSGTKVEMGAGAFFSSPKFYVGIAGQHLNSPAMTLGTTQDGKESQIKVKPIVYFTSGYNIKTRNPLISIQPSVLVQSDFTSTRVDLTGRGLYTYNEKVFWGGLTYSPGTSVGVSIGTIIKGFTVGYTYEFYTSKIGAAGGSHDIVVNYAMDINLFKKTKNKHKSIRIL